MPSTSLRGLLALGGLPASAADSVQFSGADPLFRSPYRLAAPGAASIAAAGLAAADLWALKTGRQQALQVDLIAAAAALRSNHYLKIDGRQPPRPRDEVTGFYQLQDQRWIHLHCNFFNLRDRNLAVLGVGPDRAAVAAAVALWHGEALEQAIFDAGGCCALVRNEAQWLATPQAAAVAALPLLEIIKIGEAPPEPMPAGDRPLSGIRALDLTRVLAGPTCGKTLAEHGAQVLRVSREGLPDSGMFDLDTGLGKRSTFLDLREPAQAQQLKSLIREADVFSQAYRPQSLDLRGFSPEALAQLRPGLVYVTLSAWGHTGPWSLRRGYDTIVQSANGMAWRPEGQMPAFLPVSAQDYVAGYLMAYGAMVALGRRAREGGSWLVRISLAGTGHWIRQHGLMAAEQFNACPGEISADQLRNCMIDSDSPAGRLTHLGPIVKMSETTPRWDLPAVPLGSHPPAWR